MEYWSSGFRNCPSLEHPSTEHAASLRSPQEGKKAKRWVVRPRVGRQQHNKIGCFVGNPMGPRELARASDFQLQSVGILDEDRGESLTVAVLAQDLRAFFLKFFGNLLDIVGHIAIMMHTDRAG